MSNPFYLEFKSGIAFRAVFLTASHPSLSVDLPNNLALSKDHTNNWAIEEKVDQKTFRHILKYRDSNQDHAVERQPLQSLCQLLGQLFHRYFTFALRSKVYQNGRSDIWNVLIWTTPTLNAFTWSNRNLQMDHLQCDQMAVVFLIFGRWQHWKADPKQQFWQSRFKILLNT